MLGGIKAVVWTDVSFELSIYNLLNLLNGFIHSIFVIWKVLQAFVMISSVVLVAILGVMKTGGLTEVWDRAIEGGRIFPPK